ncbi:hypothetical protein [Brevundimonas vesicularis]|nr:hypothetical protein [Brevundimonas vesicularis]
MTVQKSFLLAFVALVLAPDVQAQARLPSRPAMADRAAIQVVAPAPITLRRPGAQDGRQVLRDEAAAAQAALRAVARPIDCSDCIAGINGRAIERTTFTPGTQETPSAYVITGAGFGDAPGGVYLGGPFNTRPELRVDNWSDGRIIAYLPRGLSGETDRSGVCLIVRRADGRLVQTAATGRFYATREEQTLGFDQIPPASIRWQSDTSLEMQVRDGGLRFVGTDSGDSVKRGFSDRIILNFLKPGFEGSAFSVGFCRSDTGDGSANGSAGGRYLYGRYDARWDGDDIVIDRAMWQNHTSPQMLTSGANTFQSCFRDLRITVTGPAGVSPMR